MNIFELSSENFDEFLLTKNKTILIDFYANWCSPCKIFSKTIEQIASTSDNSLIIGKINVDDNQDLVQKYHISSIPTVLIFKNGSILKTLVGLKSKKEILSYLE